MLIDHPKIIRGLVEKFNLRPTHPQAENFIKNLAPKINEYSSRVHPFMEKIWKENYDSSWEIGSCPWCSKSDKIEE